MSTPAYTPASGLKGKAIRLAARTFAQRPLDIDLEAPLVSFTFDDFPKSAATLGARLLEDRGWRATYFASGAYAGGRTHHGAMYDVGDLKRLAAAGHEIACHTYAHADSTAVAADDVLADVARNADFLKACGHTAALDTFAFPFGEATPALKRQLSDRFSALRGVRPGVNRGRADAALLNAVPLDGGPAGLERAVDAARDAARSPGWLIYYGHDVQDTPTEWGCTPGFLQAVIAAVAESGAEVLPMNAALARIKDRAS